MSDTHDLTEYKRAKEQVAYLSENIIILDSLLEILYNNLDRPFSWPLLGLVTEYQIEYSIKLLDYEMILKQRGKIDERK